MRSAPSSPRTSEGEIIKDIDEYVTRHLTEPQSSIVGAVRALMAAHAPGAHEVISRGSPAWEGKKMIAIISRSKTHITLAFARGAEFKDPHGLLDGVGKTTRHVKLKTVSDVEDARLVDYVRQAVALDAQ
ncbi:hypothetical protein DFJ67_7455 [Asanoa ferruginea]|uniref:YdhG-like domain-containing protein n=1 Tax=Asanoa ferruginea TaxID=53367 RepID=A0A3D9ZW44_9ACTN|nr:DUF1801 domain-containing protein [Asanoa ferruginea]REG01372.1 hypothetical protein DFJ67_7455 [Asanoa ferruginea]GIF48003.1 hypothetical protein Afe04nite_25420 [Asanoa ferruginea]